MRLLRLPQPPHRSNENTACSVSNCRLGTKKLAVVTWRAHSCVPRRDSSRRLLVISRQLTNKSETLLLSLHPHPLASRTLPFALLVVNVPLQFNHRSPTLRTGHLLWGQYTQ